MKSRQKQIEEAAVKYEMGYEPKMCAGEFFRDGAYWADSHPSKYTINRILDLLTEFMMNLNTHYEDDDYIEKRNEYILNHWFDDQTHQETNIEKIFIDVSYNPAISNLRELAIKKLVEFGGIEPKKWNAIAYIRPVLYINSKGIIAEMNREELVSKGYTEYFLNLNFNNIL